MYKGLKYQDYAKRIMKFAGLFFPAYIYTLLVKNQMQYQKLWLISERGDEARDNAYHLYKYILENRKDINARFVIEKGSPDIKKIEEIGGTAVEPKSFGHFVDFILAEKLISTHLYGAAPYGKASLSLLKLLPKKHHVFLRHGIYKDKFILKDDIYDLIVLLSDNEIELVSESCQKVVDALQVIGLCRYDRLVNQADVSDDKIILIMPTFRMWLEDASRTKNRDQIFVKDPYFLCWNDLLNDERLISFCEARGYKIIFYPHNRSQKYLHNFRSKSENIILADSGSYDIQDLLVKSSVLVTDFSSVYFDFAYMKKPVAYYQFDEEMYRRLQYKEGNLLLQKRRFRTSIWE